MPRLAALLTPILAEKLTLVLDGAEDLDDKLRARLRRTRVASFSFETYSKLRHAGVDAACFDWAPAPAAAPARFSQGVLVADGLAPPNRRALDERSRLLARPRWLTALLRLVGAQRLPADVFPVPASTSAQRAVVYVAPPGKNGLNGDFLDAMAQGLVVHAPDRDLFTQFITHGVSGLIAGHILASEPASGVSLGAMARRVTARARCRFEADRARLRAFVFGETLQRRTFAQVAWPAAPATRAPRAGEMEGGRRIRGEAHADRPEAPLVTVAIVVRNARERFAPTLASVLAQDYPNLEIVVVDNESTDGTRDEIASRDARLDYWISEADNGPYDGMNKAARFARGRFLIFMNVGDFFSHATAVSQAFENPDARDADIVIGHHIYLDARGVESLRKSANFEETWRNLCAGDIGWEWLGGIPCGQAVFIRSALLRERPFDPAYGIAADHAFLYEARRCGRRFAHCDSVISVYTSGGLSGSDDRKTSKELLRLAQTYGPREKVDAWFRTNMPYAFEPD